MTLVASWINFEQGARASIWTAADTKISNGTKTITLEGSKVLELPIICKFLSGNHYGQAYYRSSIGFAYAGSSIIGLNTYATLCTIFSNLGNGIGRFPDYFSLVNKAKDIIQVYLESVQSHVEVSLWGFCPKTNVPFIGTIRTSGAEDIRLVISLHTDCNDELNCILLGSHTKAIQEEIVCRCTSSSEKSSHIYWRIPIMILREVIQQDKYQEIGGNIQIGTVSAGGYFSHYAILDNAENMRLHNIKYRNIDQLDIIGRSLGDCSIAIPALLLDIP